MEKMIMIGLRPEEDAWVRLLVGLLRSTDPVVGELTRQAMLYLEDAAGGREALRAAQSQAASRAATSGPSGLRR